jgi:signal peptide peptidase SppA
MHNRLSAPSLWAIRPEAVTNVIDLLLRDAKSANAPMLVQGGPPKPSTQGTSPNKIAIIPIQGVLSKDGPAYFGSSYDTISNAVEKAASDSNVRRIVLAVDSPGGDVQGLPETAAVIAAAAKVKPVSAIVEGASASAAYWLTSQANDITLTPSGEVGSVGVRMLHIDASKMLADAGYKITELQSGVFKTEWSPYKPLSEEAVADMQPRLDAVHKDFLAAISRGRGNRPSAAIVRSRFGEGRMFSANDALKYGLVDQIQSPREFYRSLSQPPASETPKNPGMARVALARLRLESLRSDPGTPLR